MKRVACVIALAGTTLLTGTSVLPATASPVTPKGLTLSIPRSGITSTETSTMVDMQFRGGDIRSLELFLDGNLLKKQELQTNSGKGVVTLVLDGLGDGTHSLLIRALDVNGNWVTTSTKFKVETVIEMNALAKALYPIRGQMVQGNVPIKIDVSESIRNPYVSLSMDDEWVALMNSAPFTYTWDSSKVANGLHTITADIFDDVAKVKTIKIQVNVNNAGGFTNIQNEDVVPRKKANNVVNSVANEIASKLSSSLDSLPKTTTAGNLLPTVTDVTGDMKMRMSRNIAGFKLRPDARPLLNTPKPRMSAMAPSALALLSSPVQIAGLLETKSTFVRERVALRPMGNIAVRPGVRTIALNPVARAAAEFTPTTLKNKGAFAIFFDSALVKFDVQPRLENGIPLAPFRHLFEYAGGKVEWENLTKTVLAVRNDQSVQFSIGNPDAKVNNKPLKLETAPYIDGGRSIVPVSFVGQLLNVKVSFDKETGRLLLESPKFANH